jgi:hypothetical protein
MMTGKRKPTVRYCVRCRRYITGKVMVCASCLLNGVGTQQLLFERSREVMRSQLLCGRKINAAS